MKFRKALIACELAVEKPFQHYLGIPTSQLGFLPLINQRRDKKLSLIETKQPPDDRGQQALLSSFLSYSKEINYICWNWRKKTRPGKALIEGSLSLLSGNHGRNTPQHTPEKAQDSATMHEFQNCCGSNREMSGTQQHKLCTELHINWIAGFKSFLATDRRTPTLNHQPFLAPRESCGPCWPSLNY